MEKIIFVLIFILSSLPLTGQNTYDETLHSLYNHTVPLIKSADLEEMMKTRKVILIDTRSPEEFEVSHVPGAYFLDFNSFTPEKVVKINKDLTLVLYCSVGYRSEKIGEKLLQLGFKEVLNLYGGIFSWVNEKHLVVNMKEQPTDSVHTYNQDWGKWLLRGKKVY